VYNKLYKVWDPLVRLFHWSLVFFFFLAYLLEGTRLGLHSHAGYTVALLVMFRILWGLIGTCHARFANFVTGPGKAVNYCLQLVGRTATATTGHNPAGAMMILILLASLSITAFSGTAMFAVQGSGPFSNTIIASWPGNVIQDVHAFFADLTLLLIIVHVAGVLTTSRLHNQNLTKAMVTGKKTKA